MKKLTERLLSGLLAGALVVGGAATAFAGADLLPPREGEQGHKGENQPQYHGHNAYDVLNWSPETDEYAQFMRASVPLQERNEAFNATQANPLLDQKVQCLSLMEDYGSSFFNPTQYNDVFSAYVFNFWQYEDIYASWHGVVTNPTPESIYNPEAKQMYWEWEFGVVNIPNPAYTNAAHKNGVKSLGCIFFPRLEHTDDFLYQDENGNFPMAVKLVEMAKWYGFDGYFINAEESLPASMMPMYEAFCRYMTQQGLYIQVYASNKYGENNQRSWGSIDYYNKDATEFSKWVKGVNDETIAANSLYMNPDPARSMVDGSVRTMEALGLDPKETVFNTLEAGQTGFSGTRGSLYNTFDENLVPRTGIASLGTGTCWGHLDYNLWNHQRNNDYNENRRGDPDYQKYVFARERNWWSGSLNAPTYHEGKGTLASAGLSHDELLQAVLDATFDPVAVSNGDWRKQTSGTMTWRGMSGFISERSVIDGTNFYTAFNTGHGMQYYVDGKVSNPNQWYNINDQDILPTWQWWIDTESENRLELDFDYGPTYNSGYDHIQVGGYNGPSSLAIFGTVDSKSDIRLYKTDLQILPSSKLNLTYQKPSETDDSTLSLVLYLKDGEAVRTVYLPIQGANKHTDGWTSIKLDLGKYKGETIAAFGFSVDTKGDAIENYQINLGEVSITDNRQTAPKKVDGLKIDRAFATGEVYLSWNIDDYADVQEYNVWAVDKKGNRTHVGATYDDIFYVKNSFYTPETTVAFEITAEGISGLESNPVSVAYDFDAVQNLTTEAVDGAVNVSWTGKAPKKTASVRAEVVLPDNYYGNTETYTATFKANANEGTVAVPVNDGSPYYVRVSYLDKKGNVLAYQDASGVLIDDHCENYEGGLIKRVQSSGWKLITPEVYDWRYMWVKDANGRAISFADGVHPDTCAIRGVDNLVFSDYQLPGDYVEIQLEDYNGNKSEWIKVYKDYEAKH